ncbi:hypothetical protein D9M68_916160 [compost metagenome]
MAEREGIMGNLETLREFLGHRRGIFHLEGHYTTEQIHLALCQVMLRVGGQAGIGHSRHGRMALQERRDLRRGV